MVDEDVIEDPQQTEPGPGPKLSAENTKRLAQTLVKMQQSGEKPETIKAYVSAFHKLYDESEGGVPKFDATKVERPINPAESSNTSVQQLKGKINYQQSTDPAIVAERQKYNDLRNKAIIDIESDGWRNKIFKGEKPALTDRDLPESSYQHADPDVIEKYLDAQNLDNRDRYWLRNQLLSYGKQRQMQGAIDERMKNNIRDIPEVQAAQDRANEKVMHGLIKPEEYDATWKKEVAEHPDLQPQLEAAYMRSAQQEQIHRDQATANRLNNIGLDDKPISNNAPFHDQITGVNKALMGVLNYPADIGGQISSLLELGNIPGLSSLGYKLKTNADQMKEHYAIPQNGEWGNTLAGMVPQALDMAALSRLSGAAGRPIYKALRGSAPADAVGQFAEGAIGGIAVSPANAYIMAHQYYNDLIKQGYNPAEAGSKSDQLLLKNLSTDLVALPLQMGLLKLPNGTWMQRALGKGAESAVSGLHFTAQDFNQKSTDNPALSIINYAKDDPNAKESFLTGATLGFVQKAATDAMHNWDVRSNTRRLFDFGRQYGGDKNSALPSNHTIAGTVLTAMEMKDTPGRGDEIKGMVNALEQHGTYTSEEANRIRDIIDDVSAVRGQVPKYGSGLQKMAVFNELLNQRTAQRFADQSGNKGAAKGPEEAIKESNDRIQRIMAGQEPLYFINGNETNKDQLREAIEKDPELINRPGVRIDIRNDSDFANEIKEKKNAIQEQKSDANALRHASADGPAMGQRNEGEGTIDEKSARKEEATEGVTEARHSITEHDEQGIVSGQNQKGLSDEGVTMAHELKDEVRKDHNITKIVSSDLNRAKETADIVSDGEIPVEVRPENRSWDLKDFSGTTDAEMKEALKWFGDNPDATKYDGPIEKFKGKELGESLNDYAKRVIDFRKDINQEGPGTLLINHSNNINIWDAYKANGEVWDHDAIHDYINRPSPEPATVHNQEVEDTKGNTLNDRIESGEVTGEQLKHTARLFIEDGADEKGQSIPTVQPTGESEARGDEADGASRQLSKGPSAPQNVPTPNQGQGTPGQNQAGQSIPGSAGAPDAARLTKSAKQLLQANRTDDQVLTYLKRKGMNDQEALASLGEAKANPLDQATKEKAQQSVIDKFFGFINRWLGNKELEKVNAQQRTREYQDEIKASVKAEPSQKGVSWKDVDKAIHIYLDLQRNPSHLQEYYPKLTPEQKKIVDLSQNLTDRQKKVADNIKAEYEELGKQAQNAGLIQDVLENYVARAWDLKSGKSATEENFKFATSTRHQLQRTLDTILQGYAEGMKLKIEGASNNLQVLKQEIHNVVQNKQLIDQGLSLKYNSGEQNANGKPLMKPMFTTDSKEPGYVQIENPAFQKWTRAGNIKEYPEQEAQIMGRKKDVLISEDGQVLKKEPIYAPEAIAKSMNNILGKRQSSSDLIKDLQKTNMLIKQSILSLSGFHYIAFTRAHMLSATEGINPLSAYKTGLNMLAEHHPMGQELIRNGMTLNRQQDWNEMVADHNTWVGKQFDKLGATKWMKDKLVNFNEQMHHNLFNTYGAGLKMFDGINLVKSELAKLPAGADPKPVYEKVAKLMNDTYGGINWDRMHGTHMQNPATRRLTSMLALAPDWCVDSQTRAMTKTGWKYYHELTMGDEIMMFDPITKKNRWGKLNEKYVNENYAGAMIQIKNHYRTILMTPDHKCYVYNCTTKQDEIVKAYELQTNHYIPRCAEFETVTEEVFDDYFIKVVGWVVTDGYFKKSVWKLANGEDKLYTYAKITQSKPETVEVLKEMGLDYHIDYSNCDHDKFVSNHVKYVFKIPLEINDRLLAEEINKGLSWNFLKKLSNRQLRILYNTMMLGDGTGQHRFCGKELEVFYMTLIQTMLGEASTFYQQEANCWRTRIVDTKSISCRGHKHNFENIYYEGAIWCPSVDTGFWLAERNGLVFITGNTASNLRMAKKAFERGDEANLYRKAWGRVLLRGITVTAAANLIMTAWDQKDDDGNDISYMEALQRRYQKAWDKNFLRTTMIDITPLYHAIGGAADKRAYFSIFGAYTDPIKMVTDFGDFARSKGSFATKSGVEFFSGQNWQGREFTTLDELLGMDDKGQYTKTQEGHAKGDINPNTGEPYKRDQIAHEEGEEKGGKLAGQLTKWPKGGGHAVTNSQLPSFILNEVRGLMPTAAQNIWQIAAGENDATTGILNLVGTGVLTNKEPKEEKKKDE